MKSSQATLLATTFSRHRERRGTYQLSTARVGQPGRAKPLSHISGVSPQSFAFSPTFPAVETVAPSLALDLLHEYADRAGSNAKRLKTTATSWVCVTALWVLRKGLIYDTALRYSRAPAIMRLVPLPTTFRERQKLQCIIVNKSP